MLSENILNSIRKSTTSENLMVVIDYVLGFVDPFIDAEIYQRLLEIRAKHILLLTLEDANALRVSPKAYDSLVKDFLRALSSYEHLPPVNRTNVQLQSVYTDIEDENVSKDSYNFLAKVVGVSIILMFALSFFILYCSANLNYYDANWRKAFLFLIGGIATYAVLKICSNWILYFPKQVYSYKLNASNDEGELVRVLRKEYPYTEKKNKYNWLQGWKLMSPTKKPKWIVHSKLLKWHLPIIEGFKSVLVPTIVAIGCLLLFQSYLNISFPNNAFEGFSELTEQNQRLEVIKDYVTWNKKGYSMFNKAYYTNSFFILLLVILGITGAFLSKIQQFLIRYKVVSKTLKFLYFFFIILTTFTYSGSVASDFAGEKQEANSLKIATLKYEFDALVCDIEEQLLEEQVVESILENKKLEEVLEELEEHEEESQTGEAGIEDVVRNIRIYNTSVKSEPYAFKPKYSKKKTVYKLDVFPNRPKPRQPNSSSKASKSYRSSPNQTSYNYQFTSDNAEVIWDEIKDDVTKEKINDIEYSFTNRKKEWSASVKERVKQKSKPLQDILGKYTGNRSKSSIKIAGKVITKESFTQALNAFSDNEVAKILFRSVYEKAIDPKIEQYIVKQTNTIVTEMPNPPPIKTDIDIALDKELEIIKELVINEKTHIETHYNKQNKILAKRKIKEEVKFKNQQKEKERKAKLKPKKSVAIEPRVPTTKYAFHNGYIVYTKDGQTYYTISGERIYGEPNGLNTPPRTTSTRPSGWGAGSGRSTRSYGG